ncbi:MAG: hypothetical protein IJJ60_09580 [Clostridia bacterium]|nr:hypothetical protein [Clostridia bacterium]
MFGYPYPKTTGSHSPHKELWRVEITRVGKVSEQQFTITVEKNFIPEEDVRRMAQRSKRPDADVILAWILGDERESDTDEE